MESLKLNTFLGAVKDRLRLIITVHPHILIEAPVSHDILLQAIRIFLAENVTTAN